jgi:hypothetical protein
MLCLQKRAAMEKVTRTNSPQSEGARQRHFRHGAGDAFVLFKRGVSQCIRTWQLPMVVG